MISSLGVASLAALASAHIQMDFTIQNKPSTLDVSSGLNARDVVEGGVSLASSYNFYYTKLLLGTPAQELDVIIDTGSPISWVFGPNVSSIVANNDTRFYPNESSSFVDIHDELSASYGAGSYTGIWANESAAIAEYSNKTVHDFSIGIVDMFTSAASAPGLLALGPHIGYAGPSTYKNFPEALYDQGLVDSAGFSVDLTENGGSILFGGVDISAIQYPIYWFNYTSTSSNYRGFYSVPLNSLTLNHNKTRDVIYPAIIDTGSPMSLVPTSFVNDIAAQYDLANVTQYRAWYLNGSRTPEDLQGWVTFQIGYFQVDVPVSDLFVPGEYIWGDNGPQGVQALSLIGSENNILGDAFIRHAYITFDSVNERVYLSRRNTDNTTLPHIVSPNNLTSVAIPGKINLTAESSSSAASAAIVSSASSSGVLYGPNQYLGTNSSVTTSGDSASASATSGSASGSSASGSSASSGASSSGSSSSTANAALATSASLVAAIAMLCL